MTCPKHIGISIALLTSLALLPLACGGSVETAAGGSGGLATSGGAGSGGSGGLATFGGAGSGGSGGLATSGGAAGAPSGGAGGSTGCADTCVTSLDCPADLPVCVKDGGCKVCLGPCNGQQCLGFNTCVSDADCNASPDAKCVCGLDGCTMCVLGPSGGPPGFPEALGQGVWLIGWSGGLDHYSWVRFTFQTTTTGTFTLLDAVGVTLTPFYPCEGSGPFTADPGTGVVALDLPAACNGVGSELDFVSFSDPGGFPPHALLAAAIDTTGGTISGFSHDAAFCDAAFTTCGDPFQP